MEKAREEEEQRRLQAEAKYAKHDVEECCVEQERCEKEEAEEVRGVCIESIGSSRDGVAKEQGEGARVGPGVRGGTGVTEMRLL